MNHSGFEIQSSIHLQVKSIQGGIMPEINLGVDSCLSWCIKEVRNEWKWISVFLGDLVEASKIDAKLKRAVFLPNEEDRSSVQGARGTNEPCSKVLVNELMQSGKFFL